MATHHQNPQISADERAADSRADALSALALVVIAVVTVIYWLSGQ